MRKSPFHFPFIKEGLGFTAFVYIVLPPHPNPLPSWIYSTLAEYRLRAAALPASSARYPDYRPSVNPPYGEGILCVIALPLRQKFFSRVLKLT